MAHWKALDQGFPMSYLWASENNMEANYNRKRTFCYVFQILLQSERDDVRVGVY